MSAREKFSDQEWEVLQWAVADTMAWLSVADKGFFDSFKEASGAAKFMKSMKTGAQSPLVQELAGSLKLGADKEVMHNIANMADAVIGRVREAAGLIAAKSPEDSEPFKRYILGVAKATAEAAKGVGPDEAAAIEKLTAALG